MKRFEKIKIKLRKGKPTNENEIKNKEYIYIMCVYLCAHER